MIGIYKITNPKGKIYIGQSINIESRKRTYQYSKSYITSIGPKIYNSISKYGWEAHNHDIIEDCTLEQLNERETYWKQYYVNQEGWKNMLFCGLHDNGGGPKSKETKDKISKGKLGTKGYPKGIKRPKGFGEKIKSIERNKKIGEGNKGKLKPGSGHNMPLSDKHKSNISKSSRGISRNQKPVIKFDKQMNYIQEYLSISEARKITGIVSIGDCVRGKQKTQTHPTQKFKF